MSYSLPYRWSEQSLFNTDQDCNPPRKSTWKDCRLRPSHFRFRNTQKVAPTYFPCSAQDLQMALWLSSWIWFFYWALLALKTRNHCIAQESRSEEWCFAQTRTCNFPLQMTTARTKCWLKFSLVVIVLPSRGFWIRKDGRQVQDRKTARILPWLFMNRSRWLMLIAYQSSFGLTFALPGWWFLWEQLDE